MLNEIYLSNRNKNISFKLIALISGHVCRSKLVRKFADEQF